MVYSWCQSSSYLSSCRSCSLRCNRVSDYHLSCKLHGTNDAFTYNRGSAAPGHVHILHPATRQQRHLQVEQVSRQEAARLGGVEAHPGRNTHGESSCQGRRQQSHLPLVSGHLSQSTPHKIVGD